MPLPAQVSTEGQGAESGGTHTLAGVLSGTIPGNRSVLNWASTDPELTGENAGRCGVGNLFPRSFAGRDDASEKDCRMVVGLENRQAQEGNNTDNRASNSNEKKSDSCGGDKSYWKPTILPISNKCEKE